MSPRVTVDEVRVRAMAQKHGLNGPVSRMPKLGIVNDIWSIGGDYVLRVPLEQEYADTLFAESIAAPAARAAGVRTPEVVVFDHSLEDVPVPYMVTRMVSGQTLGAAPSTSSWEAAAYEWSDVLDDLARELVTLHQKVNSLDDPNGWLNPWWLDDPLEGVNNSVEKGLLSTEEARWVEAFVENLRRAFSYDPAGPCDLKIFVHHDLHPSNVMVTDPPNGETCRLAAILDWGNACWGDSAVDFGGFPLWALPPLLDAYRLAGGAVDDTFEGRVLYMWLALALAEPSFLDPVAFVRHWWRLPLDGVGELRYRLLLMPERWRQWTVER